MTDDQPLQHSRGSFLIQAISSGARRAIDPSARTLAGISEARWRQIMKGHDREAVTVHRSDCAGGHTGPHGG
jgi:hypothetical protein